MKPTPFQQSQPFGCGHYVLANFFNNEKYLDDIVPQAATTEYMQNQSLAKHDPELHLETLFFLNPGIKSLPARMDDVRFFDTTFQDTPEQREIHANYCRAYCCIIRDGLLHAVLVLHDFATEYLYVVDSLQPIVQRMTKRRFMRTYDVVGMSHFNRPGNYTTQQTPEETIIFRKDHLTHLIY